MQKFLFKSLLALGIFALVSISAVATETKIARADLNEECYHEGCDSHEVWELYDSFVHECSVEGCWYEEVHELAGGSRVPDYLVFDQNQIHYQMFRYFSNLFGTISYPCYNGYTTPDPLIAVGYIPDCWPNNNFAVGKRPVASSTEASWAASWMAFDGNRNTRWSSNYNDSNYVYIDLGKPTNFNRIKLWWEAAYGKRYGLYIWNEIEGIWVPIYYEQNGNGGLDDIWLPLTYNGRYIAMSGFERATSWGYSLWEFEIYNELNSLQVSSSQYNKESASLLNSIPDSGIGEPEEFEFITTAQDAELIFTTGKEEPEESPKHEDEERKFSILIFLPFLQNSE